MALRKATGIQSTARSPKTLSFSTKKTYFSSLLKVKTRQQLISRLGDSLQKLVFVSLMPERKNKVVLAVFKQTSLLTLIPHECAELQRLVKETIRQTSSTSSRAVS